MGAGHIASLMDRRDSGDKDQDGQKIDLETAIVRTVLVVDFKYKYSDFSYVFLL
jgi:hypothetical protein